jgi:hypothetical protein
MALGCPAIRRVQHHRGARNALRGVSRLPGGSLARREYLGHGAAMPGPEGLHPGDDALRLDLYPPWPGGRWVLPAHRRPKDSFSMLLKDPADP